MGNVIIPSAEEFMSVFGCDCNIDDDFLILACTFKDIDQNSLEFSVGMLDDSLRIFLSIKNEFVLEIFESDVELVSINEKDQCLNIRIKQSSMFAKNIRVNLFPKFSVISKCL